MEKNYNYNYENRSQGQKLPIGYSNLGVSSCTSKVLDKSPVTNGSLWHTTDKNEFYYDWNGSRIKLNLTGDSSKILAELNKIKEEIAKLDPNAVQQKVDILEGKVNTAVSTVNNLKADVDGAVKDAQKAAQVAQKAADQVADKVDAEYVNNAIAGKADASVVTTLQNTVSDLETSISNKANASDVTAVSQAISNKADASDVTTLQNTVSSLQGTKVDKSDLDVYAKVSWVEGKGFLTAQDISGKANVSDLKTVATTGNYNDLENKPDLTGFATTSALDTLKSDLSTGSFPQNVDDKLPQSEGYAKVQDVMNYVNALIEKKKGELAPIEPGTPYAYITGYALDGTPTDITMFNQFELNKSGDTELEIWSAKEIGSYDENGNDLPSIKLTVDIPSDYSIKESYEWNPLNSIYVLVENGLFEQNPRYASRTINGVVYNSYVRKASSQINTREDTRYKIIFTK